MAKVADIIFCLNATNLPGQGACANTILTTITPDYIPGLYTFSVVITILALDTTSNHALEISFACGEEEVARIEGEIPPMEDPSNLPAEYKGVNLSINWNNINFKTEGEYCLKIVVDGDEVGSKTVFVKGKNQE